MYDCKWVGIVLPIVILVFAIWPEIVSWSNWVVIISAILLLLHHWIGKCKTSELCQPEIGEPATKKKSKK